MEIALYILNAIVCIAGLIAPILAYKLSQDKLSIVFVVTQSIISLGTYFVVEWITFQLPH